jgi:hypothetical protein
VAAVVGGKSRRALRVGPGKPTRRLLRMAACRVVRVGENSAACAKATSSPVRRTWFTKLVLWWGGSVGVR